MKANTFQNTLTKNDTTKCKKKNNLKNEDGKRLQNKQCSKKQCENS